MYSETNSYSVTRSAIERLCDCVPPPPPQTSQKRSTNSLTDVHHVYFHGVRVRTAQRVGGHHRDVVVDPDRRVVLVEEAGVLSGCAVVRALVHGVGAATQGRRRRLLHVIVRWHCAPPLTFPHNSMRSSCSVPGNLCVCVL